MYCRECRAVFSGLVPDLNPFAAVLIAALMVVGGSASDFPPVSQLPKNSGFPDPLTMFDGTKVTTREQWFARRRPELKALFEHYEFGRIPPKPAKIEFSVKASYGDFMDGKATVKLVSIAFGDPVAPSIDLMLILPNERKADRAPVFLGLNWNGNQSLTKDPRVPLVRGWIYPDECGKRTQNGGATEESRGCASDTFPFSQILARGYGVATFCSSDIEADIPDASGGLYAWLNRGAKGPTTSQFRDKVIAAWAWGLHRAVDYLVQDPDVDRGRIALTGHSRYGKTAIFAAAFDERIALVVPASAGQGGTAPSRTSVGETIKEMNEEAPHWYNEQFRRVGEQPELLPFDHHALIALVAPRPVLLTEAEMDIVSNPHGSFQMLTLAGKVYEFLGEPGLGVTSMPPMGQIVTSRLGYFIRPGEHSVIPQDWKAYLDFADAQLPAMSSKPAPTNSP